jgi:hypothetical protein
MAFKVNKTLMAIQSGKNWKKEDRNASNHN